ncbi:MAG: tetratricopeptide repeat protein [Gemmataceae bacterium]|nr:tetratricopeptide repeat protein [Gemmataceae bacterium]
MVQPLILQYFQLLPERHTDEEPANWPREYRKALLRFKRAVEARYLESTLERLLFDPDIDTRQAAVLALGLMGSIKISPTVALCLHDEDESVRRIATESLWAIWQRGDSTDNNQELQRLMRMIGKGDDATIILAGFDVLLRKAPRFAEAYNQRAIVHFKRGDYVQAIRDCEKAMRLNPHHFGAATGMGQCFMKQKKLRAALRIYRRASRINPNLHNVRETIVSLERMLGEEGKR